LSLPGGPGAGKTTLINLLSADGFATAPEAGRAIIQDHTAIGGPALPWADTALFAELMLSRELRSYRWALQQCGPVFFDHAIPGLPAYYRLIGREVPAAHVEAAVTAFPYRAQAFIAPPWPEIYRNDAERRQSLDEARRTHEALVDAYTRYGYDLIGLPLTGPRERLRFVLESLDFLPEDRPTSTLRDRRRPDPPH
jgi:predicted ATPase